MNLCEAKHTLSDLQGLEVSREQNQSQMPRVETESSAEDRPEKRRIYLRAWRKAHPGYAKQQSSKRRLLHRESVNDYQRKWQKENRALYLSYKRKYYETHRADWKRNTARWKSKNKGSVAIFNHSYRIKRLLSPSTEDSKMAIKLIRKSCRGKCFYCGKIRPLTVEHIVSLAAGGHHSAFNIVGACSSCNHAKGAKHPNQFIRNGQLIIAF